MAKNEEIYNGLNEPNDNSSLYPYTVFTNAGATVCEVKCDDTKKENCPYLNFLKNDPHTKLRISHMGRITIIELNFWHIYSPNNRPYPGKFCRNCIYNRAR